MSSVFDLTDRITTLEASSTDDQAALEDKLRFRRLNLMTEDGSEVEQYLSDHLATDASSNLYLNMLHDYLLVAVGPVFVGFTGSDSSAGIGVASAIARVREATSTEAQPGVTMMTTQLLNDIAPDSVRDALTSGVFFLNDLSNSGAYNIFAAPFRLSIGDGHVRATALPVIEEESDGLVVRGDPKEGSDDTPPFVLTNAVYDQTTGEIIEYGMLPFGMYPCNDVEFFKILSDRLIHVRTETPIVCIGKTIESPDDLSTYFSDSTDFSKRQGIYQMSTSTFERAQNLDVSGYIASFSKITQ